MTNWIERAQARLCATLCRSLCLSFFWVAQMGVASQSMTPFGWLQSMDNAHREKSYEGVFVQGMPSNLTSFQITYSRNDGVEREKVVRLDGVYQEVLRTNKMLVCRFGGSAKAEERQTKTSVEGVPFAKDRAQGFHRASKYFHLSQQDGGRVAGYETVRIDLMPKIQNRYGYRLWVSKRHHMLLKSEMLSLDGKVLDLFQFTVLNVDPVLSDDWFEFPSAEIEGLSQRSIEIVDQSSQSWGADWLPDGFSLVSETYSWSNKKENGLVYSDGLVTFSVFVDKLNDIPEGMITKKQMGATSAIMLNQSIAGQAFLITVVGEIPMQTASRIARSIKLKKS